MTLIRDLARQMRTGEKKFIRRFYDALPLYDIVNIKCTSSDRELEVLPPFIELIKPISLKFQETTPHANALDISVIKEITGNEYSPAEAGVIRSFFQRWHWENSYNLLNSGSLSARFAPTYAYFTDLDKSRLMAPCDVVVDVGSYIGLIPLKALALGKEVVAIEGQTEVAEIALANIENNISALRFQPRYEVINILAVGRAQDIHPIHRGNQALYAVSTDCRVQTAQTENCVAIGKSVCLDTVLCEKLIDKKIFMSIEINGNEVTALSGATNILKNASKGSACRFPIIYPEHDAAGLERKLVEATSLFKASGWRLSARHASGKGYFVVAAKL